MRCYINYNPNQPIPIGRTTSRGIYEETPYLTPSELLKYKTRLINADRTMSQTARYTYLINNPIKTYGTQSDEYTNPNINNDNNIDKQYIEQKSMPLPEVKKEEIIRNQTTLQTPNNEPVIPKTEIIKQLNEMNKKIDSLYEVVFKLTKMIENNKEENNQENI